MGQSLTVTPAPAVDQATLFRLYSAGEYDTLSKALLGALDYFNATLCTSEDMVRQVVSPFLKTLFYLFTQPDYFIPDPYMAPFILKNALISNLTAISPFRTTDAFLEIVRFQPLNLIKVLTLYSARNTVSFDRSELFAAEPKLASLWYYQFCSIYKSGLVREDITRRVAEHLNHHDDRLLPAYGMSGAYYGSSYVDINLDRSFKPFLNNTIKKHVRIQVSSKPDPKRIAIFSDFWYPTHSVYRNYAAYVKALKGHYHLTLLHQVMPEEHLDVSMFDEVRLIEMPNGSVRADQLDDRFQLIYFPDIGMTDPSILFSNCRIAPVQICSLGHSVSTWGGEMDYFISGADVEMRKGAENNYSERLVLLPGMGVVHNQPRYKAVGVKKQVSEILINCPWSAQKICAPFLRILRTLVERAKQPVRLRIFPNSGILQANAYLAFNHDLRTALGDHAIFEIHPIMPYDKYMQLMEEGDMTIDSFHFAGCNTIADSLFLRKPTVVWEGDKWYNRIGPAMLRLVGMEEFVCATEAEYLEKMLLLINDNKRRAKVQAKLQSADLDTTLFSARHAPAFLHAVDYLIANHEKLSKQQAKQPILIR